MCPEPERLATLEPVLGPSWKVHSSTAGDSFHSCCFWMWVRGVFLTPRRGLSGARLGPGLHGILSLDVSAGHLYHCRREHGLCRLRVAFVCRAPCSSDHRGAAVPALISVGAKEVTMGCNTPGSRASSFKKCGIRTGFQSQFGRRLLNAQPRHCKPSHITR